MKVICAGLPKSGTKTLAAALRTLGYNVYDIEEQFYAFSNEWYDLVKHGKLPNFKSMLENVDAVTDMPANFYFAEILEAFPDAKVILSVREEAAWLSSVAKEIEESQKFWNRSRIFVYMSPLCAKLKEIVVPVATAAFGTNNPSATQIHRHHFHMHNRRVQNTVPKDQLLIYNVKQGWGPICEFLGKQVPEKPFPHQNKGSSWTRDYQISAGENELQVQIFRETVIGISIVVAFFAVVLFAYFTFGH